MTFSSSWKSTASKAKWLNRDGMQRNSLPYFLKLGIKIQYFFFPCDGFWGKKYLQTSVFHKGLLRNEWMNSTIFCWCLLSTLPYGSSIGEVLWEKLWFWDLGRQTPHMDKQSGKCTAGHGGRWQTGLAGPAPGRTQVRVGGGRTWALATYPESPSIPSGFSIRYRGDHTVFRAHKKMFQFLSKSGLDSICLSTNAILKPNFKYFSPRKFYISIWRRAHEKHHVALLQAESRKWCFSIVLNRDRTARLPPQQGPPLVNDSRGEGCSPHSALCFRSCGKSIPGPQTQNLRTETGELLSRRLTPHSQVKGEQALKLGGELGRWRARERDHMVTGEFSQWQSVLRLRRGQPAFFCLRKWWT